MAKREDEAPFPGFSGGAGRLPRIIGRIDTLNLRDVIADLPLAQRSVVLAGKSYPQPRLTAWFGPCAYEYSGLRHEPDGLPIVVAYFMGRVREMTGQDFNSCLANYYRDGSDCAHWHSDDEPLFGPRPVVASLSLGCTRLFVMRRKSDHKEKLRFDLDHGSVLLMPAGTQEQWEHSLPRTDTSPGPRLNLTFRRVV